MVSWTPVPSQLGIQHISVSAGNGAGSDTQSFSLNVIDTRAPARAANMRFTEIIPSSITLAWDKAADNVGIASYQVFEYIYVSRFFSYYRPLTDLLPGDSASTTLAGLTPNTLYKFAIQTCETVGNCSILDDNWRLNGLEGVIATRTYKLPGVFRPTDLYLNPITLTVGQLFTINLDNVVQPAPAFRLVSGPAGMVLRHHKLYWVPQPGQEGEVSITLTPGNNNSGDAYTYIYPVNPSAVANHPPALADGQATPKQLWLPANVVTLSGLALDDGIPAPANLSYSWSMVSGPGAVSFVDATTATTKASFPLAGTYSLRLTVSDGALESSTDVSVIVSPALAANNPPTVQAWDTTPITLPLDATSLSAIIVDLGGLGSSGVAYAWHMVSGPGIVDFTSAKGKTYLSRASTWAYFSAAGTYTIELSASDGELTTSLSLDQMVNPEPLPTVNPPPGGGGAEPVEFEGPIEEVGVDYLIVNSISVFFTDATVITFEDGTGGAFAVGLIAAVIGNQNDDGSVTATSIMVAP